MPNIKPTLQVLFKIYKNNLVAEVSLLNGQVQVKALWQNTKFSKAYTAIIASERIQAQMYMNTVATGRPLEMLMKYFLSHGWSIERDSLVP
ncbi:MAG TPA: hypothetical protein VFR58_05100 [Flavisolibacter sp.]|nr:hypothetical protein [Flavisolibacter sp.]